VLQGEVKMKVKGFDNTKYINLQSQKIRDRIAQFGDKLYLEFGGKLFDDYHAARVLPGFEPDAKVKMLLELKDEAEVVIVINADAIEKNKQRGDLGITYDLETLRLIDAFRKIGLYVGSVVITCYTGHPSAQNFEKRLTALGITVYRHYPIADYPSNIPHIVSEEGFGKNDYIKTERKLVIVTAPGPGSGKMATCLSQLYHDNLRGIKAGYSKFETFPVWNLPLKHPVNIAYEAATADLNDINMIDSFHLDAYGEMAVNYNRDIEIFPVLNSIMETILGESPYKSPTDMGVNMAGFAIYDNDAVCDAAKQEIIRRYYSALVRARQGMGEQSDVQKIEFLMNQLKIGVKDRPVVAAALDKAAETDGPATALQLADGRIITGKTSSLLGASSALILNCLKALAEIPDEINLISPTIIEPIQKLKTEILGNHNPRLHIDEVLEALSICAVTSDVAKKALDQAHNLKDLEAHSTVILSRVDENVFKKLGVNITFEPKYQTKKLYHN
jgi:uncharacterized protein (UPF0371 family)